MRHALHVLLLLVAALTAQAVDTMPKFFGEVRTRTGDAQPGARAQVTLVGTGTLATLYADDEVTAKVNPLTADSTGLYQFKAAPGIYDITVSVNGQVVDIRQHVPLGTLTATVSSVALTMPAEYSVAGSPITTGGTLAVTKATELANYLWAGPTSGGSAAPTFRAAVAADIPSLDVSKLTTGQLALARGGTHADLSATGGTGQYLRQTSVGANIDVGTITSSDIAGALLTPGPIGTGTPGSSKFTDVTDTGLTSARVVITTTGGLLLTSSDFSYSSNVFTTGSGTGAPGHNINGAAANERFVEYETGGLARWRAMAGSGAESGSNAGSSYIVRAFDDAGTLIDSPIVITRAAGGTFTTTRPFAAPSATFTAALPIASGGTNSTTALSGSSIMVSDGTHVVQGTAGTTTTVLHGNASGSPTYGAVSLTADVSGLLPVANGGTNASSASSARSNLGVAIDTINGMIELPSAKTYNLIISSEVAYTVNEVIIQTASGTCTAAVKINGTNITGASAISVSSTPTTATCTAANTISTTQALTLVLSSLSSAVDVSFTVKLTK